MPTHSTWTFFSDWLLAPAKEKTLKEKTVSEIQYYASARQLRTLKRLNSPNEIHEFLEEFWLQMDPSPGTVRNECRLEHYKRMDYVKMYYPDIRGWGSSDRGRVYILYGPPDEIVKDLYLETENFKSAELWLYNKPAGNNLLSLGMALFNPGQMQFLFANEQYLEKYTQVFSTEDGEICDPRLFQKWHWQN